MEFSVVVPVFNEEKTVRKAIEKVKRTSYPGSHEIIVIDDASSDNSLEILESIKDINLLKNRKNMGKGFSLRKGFGVAKGEIILIQDADLEYNPNEHLKLIKCFNKNTHVVYGSRFLKKNHKPRYRLFYFGNLLLSLITRLLYGTNITDMETCYKVFRKSVLRNIRLTADRFDFEPEITCKLIKQGYKILEVPIRYKSRSYKEGKKIGFIDGLKAIFVLFRYRFFN